MHPALSVILLTVLIGAAQGLAITVYMIDALSHSTFWPAHWPDIRQGFFVSAYGISFVLLIAGLIASFFHLGRPERFWRAAAKWRTSWLSREVILLSAFIGCVGISILMHALPTATWANLPVRLTFGAVTTTVGVVLFITTGMIYACIKFLPEWAAPITVVNFTTLGLASGSSLCLALAVIWQPMLSELLVPLAIVLTALALLVRVLQLLRNRRLRPKTTLASALGIRHGHIRQTSPGFMGGSFNTREFFHGKSRPFLNLMLALFLALAFFLPIVALYVGFKASGMVTTEAASELVQAGGITIAATLLAALIQLVGIAIERWYFFADAHHAQNNYYQRVD